MKKHVVSRQYRRNRHFTLVEIMVSMAILVILMGFLFQFTRGAQKIWLSSARKLDCFENAQLVMDLLETDLKKMVMETLEENPDGGIPIYLDVTGDKQLKEMCFMAALDAMEPSGKGIGDDNLVKRVGVYPVHYQMISANRDNKAPYRLYRYQYDRLLAGAGPFFAYGADAEHIGDFKSNLDAMRKAAIDEGNMREMICDTIESLKIEFFPNESSTLLATKKPVCFKVTVEVREASDNKKVNPQTRLFSKIIFVNDAQ